METQIQTLEKQAVTIYKMFGLIYNFNAEEIINSAWDPATDPHMNSHFKTKFSGLCQSEGYASANAVLRFAGALTRDNAAKFCMALAQKISE